MKNSFRLTLALASLLSLGSVSEAHNIGLDWRPFRATVAMLGSNRPIFTEAWVRKIDAPPFNAYSIATLGGNCGVQGSVLFQSAAGLSKCLGAGASGQVLKSGGPGVDLSWQTVTGSGTVSSVGLSLPAEFTVAGSPVVAAGTLTAVWASQTANKFHASPNGSSGAPAFRAIVGADIPAVNLAASGNGGVTGSLPVGQVSGNWPLANVSGLLGATYGGSGLSNPTAHQFIVYEGAGAAVSIAMSDACVMTGRGSASDPVCNGISGDISISDTGAALVNKIQGTSVSTPTGSGAVVLAVSPALTGAPTAPTQSTSDASTDIATDAFVHNVAAAATPATVPWAATGGLPTTFTGTTNANGAATISNFIGTDATDVFTINWGTSKSWVVSNGNAINGYAGGTTLPNSSTIHMYACHGASGDGAYASTVAPGSFTSANCPAGYTTYARRLFSFTTGATGVPNLFTPVEIEGGGYLARLAATVTDQTTVDPTSATLETLGSLPLGLYLEWNGATLGSGGSSTANGCAVWDGLSSSAPAAPYQMRLLGSSFSQTGTGFNVGRILTNLSSQVYAVCGIATTASLYTFGWSDPRRM